jgi:hypothetical protein
MVTIVVLSRVVISTEDTKLHHKYFIQLYGILKDLQKSSHCRDSLSYSVIYMVIQGAKMYSCMEMLILLMMKPLDCFHLLCQKFVTLISHLTTAGSKYKSLKNHQQE